MRSLKSLSEHVLKETLILLGAFLLGTVVGWLLVAVPVFLAVNYFVSDLGDGNPFGLAIILALPIYIVGPLIGVMFGVGYAYLTFQKRRKKRILTTTAT